MKPFSNFNRITYEGVRLMQLIGYDIWTTNSWRIILKHIIP